MNKFFNFFIKLVTLLASLFLLIPFLAVLLRGLGFVFEFPYTKEVTHAIKLTIWTSLLATSICSFLTLIVVYAKDNFDFRLKKIIDYIYTLPMATPHIVSGIGLLIVYGRRGIGTFLYETFSIDFVYTIHGIWLAMLFINLPYSFKTLDTSYSLINKKLIFISRTLGLNELQSFIFVVLPLLKKQILGMVIMNFSRSIGEFGAIMILVGVTQMKTATLSTSIFLNMSTGELDVAAGISALLLIISAVSTFVLERIIEDDKNA